MTKELFKNLGLGLGTLTVVSILWAASYSIVYEILYSPSIYKDTINSLIAPFPSLEQIDTLLYIEMVVVNTVFIVFGLVVCFLYPRPRFNSAVIIFSTSFILLLGFDYIPGRAYPSISGIHYFFTLLFWAMLVTTYFLLVNKVRSNR